MRSGLACLLTASLVLGGCGFGGEEERPAQTAGVGGEPASSAPLPPDGTPQPLRYVGGSKAQLAAGAIAVVDVTKRVAVAPDTMDVNREQRLSELAWDGWGAPEAIGRGEVSTLICEPNCATGRRESSRATIVLSRPKRCGARRFYTRSSMTYQEPGTGKTRAPSTYLRTPSC
jgi:hypothetical protein